MKEEPGIKGFLQVMFRKCRQCNNFEGRFVFVARSNTADDFQILKFQGYYEMNKWNCKDF